MQEMRQPGSFSTPQEILIEQGTTGNGVAQKLHQAGIINRPEIFYTLLRLDPTTIQAGEYLIPAHSSLSQVLEIFKSGKVLQRSFGFAEGLTVKQVILRLNNVPTLVGDITELPKEGTLLPDTYQFLRGDTRDSLIKRMQQAHTLLLEKLWAAREENFPLQTPEEAVTLASIVEKETGIAEERAKIAGLFYNRLKIGMPLQTDPTVVYAITDGLGHMEGKRLYSKHLQVDSPYNTYRIPGLPPAPIANPGRASLEAVFAPESHDYLYFVADGTGGHVFAKDLPGHEKNVREWRIIRKKIEAAN